MTSKQLPPIRFGDDGLIPAVIADAATGTILMLGFMNEEALAATRATGRTHFWSRSRGKLWQKGETSGHEQIVEEIFVNCEQDSLLVTVRQLGAVCHDGYPTCYYRRLEPDNRLTVVQERVFDPVAVYGVAPTVEPSDLSVATRQLYGAYEFLCLHDLAAVSSTSRHLRAGTDTITRRVADELGELAGVLDGTHRHDGFEHDLRLEATQVMYWAILAAVREGLAWETLRLDQGLTPDGPEWDRATLADRLGDEAARWHGAALTTDDLLSRCRAVLALVGAVCRTCTVNALDLVTADLAELRGRPYLAPYFAGE